MCNHLRLKKLLHWKTNSYSLLPRIHFLSQLQKLIVGRAVLIYMYGQLILTFISYNNIFTRPFFITREKLLNLALKQVLLQQQIEQQKQRGEPIANAQVQAPVAAAQAQYAQVNAQAQFTQQQPLVAVAKPNSVPAQPVQQNFQQPAQQRYQAPPQQLNQYQQPAINTNVANSFQVPAAPLPIQSDSYVIDRSINSNAMLNTYQQVPHPLYAQCTAPAGPTGRY